MPNIVIIGAASASFGPNTLATLIRSERLRGSRIGLVDLDPAGLARMEQVAQRMNDAWQAQMEICATTQRRELLPGADFVIVSIEAPPREVLWRMDWEIPLKHGLRQPYGENGGPGGMMHTFRQLPNFMAIAKDMEELCPDAWLINYSNPLPRLPRAVARYSQVKVVGKCHQLAVGYGIAATLLAEHFGFEVPEGIAFYSDPSNATKGQMVQLGQERLVIQAAGLNHFTWILDARDKETGEDLYPLMRQAAHNPPPTLEPLSMELFRIFGYCPVPGDTHLCEYLPWTHDAESRPWERYQLRLYDWTGNEAFREFSHYTLAQMAAGKMDVAGMRDAHSEGAVELIEALSGLQPFYDQAVNVPNGGAIPNLPVETIVELPAYVDGAGVHPLSLPPLPPPIAELCRREAALVEVVVEAGVTGDRDLALQALLLDPMVNDIGRAQAILDDYLTQFADYLPQFKEA